MIYIKKSDMAAALQKAQETYILAGPVKDRHGHMFRELEKGESPDLEYSDTRMSPKHLVFPQAEMMFFFSHSDTEQNFSAPEDIPFDDMPRAVIGIRPYDAKAIDMLKINFDTDDTTDPYFIRRYENLTRVGLAETCPGKTNFSTSCGTGPFDETFLDLILLDTGSEYLGKILTPKGDEFAAAAGFSAADDPAEQIFEDFKKKAEAQISSRVAFDEIEKADTLELYNAPFWKDLAFPCLNCGTCTFACPTCWCFDIQDETVGGKGTRMRLWDSCMSGIYSAHASGHNPRGEAWQRFRNRFMHKLKYFADKSGQGIMCVGCGRCINACPVNIDIRDITRILNHEEAPK